MAVSRDDQNTFLMIGGVLIICLIALIAVISSIWALVRDPVNAVINTVSTFIRIQTLDYNFAIPVVTVVTPAPVPQPTPTPSPTPINIPPVNLSFAWPEDKDIEYNFPVNNISTTQFNDALYTDTDLVNKNNKGESVEQKDLSIQIPALSINSPILQGLDSESLLEEGFWVIPSNKKLTQSEVIMLCNRRFFGPTDPRSCWYLDKIAIGNLIVVTYNGFTANYSVVGINRFNAEDPLVYQSSNDEDLIRIVTTDPLNSNENRLVILAQRVS